MMQSVIATLAIRSQLLVLVVMTPAALGGGYLRIR